MKRLPSVEELNYYFRYDAESGDLYWRNTTNKRIAVGSKIAYKSSRGYIKVFLNGQSYFAHRVIYKMVTEADIDEYIVDHIDKDITNNRFDNLQLLDVGQHNHDAEKAQSNCVSGIRNVSVKYSKTGEILGWRARINGKQKYFSIKNGCSITDVIEYVQKEKALI